MQNLPLWIDKMKKEKYSTLAFITKIWASLRYHQLILKQCHYLKACKWNSNNEKILMKLTLKAKLNTIPNLYVQYLVTLALNSKEDLSKQKRRSTTSFLNKTQIQRMSKYIVTQLKALFEWQRTLKINISKYC